MPYNGLEGFRQRRDQRDRRHDCTGIGNLGREAAIPPHDAADFGSDLFGVLQGYNQVDAGVQRAIATADGQDQDQVLFV